MNCPKCGFTVNENDAFCRACGTNVRPYMQNSQNQQNVESNNMMSQPNQGYDYHSQFQAQNNNTQNYDINNSGNNYNEELIDAYIGKNADKIKSGKFSWPSFFFGIIYVWYRKMWGLGFLVLLISFAISFIISLFLPSLSLFSGLIVGIIVGIIFNKAYLNKVKEKVEKIVRENPGKTKEELKAICSKKGGTTIIPIVIVVGLYLAITAVASIIVMGTINDVADRANCANIGGIWKNGKCINR